MTDKKNTTPKSGARKRRARLPARKPYASRAELRADLAAECERGWRALFGTTERPDLAVWLRGVDVPEIERKAQAIYARARRELRALLAAVPDGTVCGPCTSFVNDQRAAIDCLVRDHNGKGTHWRQHSAERLTPTGIAVDVWGASTRNGRRFTDRELAMIAILYGAKPAGDSVVECLRSQTEAIRADRERQRNAAKLRSKRTS